MKALQRLSALCCALSALVPWSANSAETTTTSPAPAVAPLATPVPVKTVDAARVRLSTVQSAIEVLDEQIALPASPALTPAQLVQWNEHGDWLSSVRERYADFLAENGGAFGDTPGLMGAAGKDMMQKMAQMNLQFLELQQATQTESRRFQTLSNASKARHEVAMNAIRNMK
jgi:hypothetical protein